MTVKERNSAKSEIDSIATLYDVYTSLYNADPEQIKRDEYIKNKIYESTSITPNCKSGYMLDGFILALRGIIYTQQYLNEKHNGKK